MSSASLLAYPHSSDSKAALNLPKMARCDIRAGRICNAGRGRATGLFWESPELASVGWGTLRLPGSPQSRDSQLRSHNLAVHAISCENTGYHEVNHCLPDEELGSVANLLPKVCKLMHEHQPRKSKESYEVCPQKFMPVRVLLRDDRQAAQNRAFRAQLTLL
jgi:hypothetical protein